MQRLPVLARRDRVGDDAAAGLHLRGQVGELAPGGALFMGFAKGLISMGLEPVEMDTTVVPTPDLPPGAAAANSHWT